MIVNLMKLPWIESILLKVQARLLPYLFYNPLAQRKDLPLGLFKCHKLSGEVYEFSILPGYLIAREELQVVFHPNDKGWHCMIGDFRIIIEQTMPDSIGESFFVCGTCLETLPGEKAYFVRKYLNYGQGMTKCVVQFYQEHIF